MTAAIDGYKHRCRRILAAPGLAMLASIVLTEALLGAQGRWAEALPLHLCSVASIMAVLVAWGARGFALDYLWYLGMPGATLALLFPAPAVSRWQGLFDASYYATHALIVVIPVLASTCLAAYGAVRLRQKRSRNLYKINAPKIGCRNETDRKSTRLNSSHCRISRMPSSA